MHQSCKRLPSNIGCVLHSRLCWTTNIMTKRNCLRSMRRWWCTQASLHGRYGVARSLHHTCMLPCCSWMNTSQMALGDPIRLSGAASPDLLEEPPIFYLCYVKGAARTSMALVLMDQIMLCKNFQLWDVFPGLAKSLSCAHAKKVLSSADPVNIAFMNATLSQQGSIRRAHDVLTWLGTFVNVRNSRGHLDDPDLIKTWNSTASRQAQVTGRKRAALLNLLPCLPEIIDTLLDFVSRVGTGGKCYAEEVFANFRIMPGFTTKAFKPIWNNRLSVTPKSFHSMLKLSMGLFERKPVLICKMWEKHTARRHVNAVIYTPFFL